MISFNIVHTEKGQPGWVADSVTVTPCPAGGFNVQPDPVQRRGENARLLPFDHPWWTRDEDEALVRAMGWATEIGTRAAKEVDATTALEVVTDDGEFADLCIDGTWTDEPIPIEVDS